MKCKNKLTKLFIFCQHIWFSIKCYWEIQWSLQTLCSTQVYGPITNSGWFEVASGCLQLVHCNAYAVVGAPALEFWNLIVNVTLFPNWHSIVVHGLRLSARQTVSGLRQSRFGVSLSGLAQSALQSGLSFLGTYIDCKWFTHTFLSCVLHLITCSTYGEIQISLLCPSSSPSCNKSHPLPMRTPTLQTRSLLTSFLTDFLLSYYISFSTVQQSSPLTGDENSRQENNILWQSHNRASAFSSGDRNVVRKLLLQRIS